MQHYSLPVWIIKVAKWIPDIFHWHCWHCLFFSLAFFNITDSLWQIGIQRLCKPWGHQAREHCHSAVSDCRKEVPHVFQQHDERRHGNPQSCYESCVSNTVLSETDQSGKWFLNQYRRMQSQQTRWIEWWWSVAALLPHWPYDCRIEFSCVEVHDGAGCLWHSLSKDCHTCTSYRLI